MLHTSLEDLNPLIQSKVRSALAGMAADPLIGGVGLTIVVLETRRELTTQMAYFSRGRMAPDDVKAMFASAKLWGISDAETKKQVTWTLDSKHLGGLAFDAAPSKDGKTPWWGAPDEVWQRMAEVAELYGLKAGYRWKTKDSPHYEGAI